MKKQFFIANWKSHKTPKETTEWFENFARHMGRKEENDTILVCPPFPLLSLCRELAHKHTPYVSIGAQDISYFPEGAYTGEVSGRLIGSLATHVIIGHSERRSYFDEREKVLSEKVLMAQANMLTPIFCISSKNDSVPKRVKIVAYEPIEAIGTGDPASPETVEQIAHGLKEKNDADYILYGGSVDAKNVASYTSLPSINGVLVGTASLDPQEFAHLIQHA